MITNTKLYLPILALLMALSGFTFEFSSSADNTISTDKTISITKPAPAKGIKWLSIEEAAAKQKHEPRKVFIDVYTDWCGWCKKMDKATFSDPAVAAYVNENYYAVKLNAESKDPITLKGNTYKYNPEYKSHELAVALLQGQLSFPTTVYLNEKMEMITPVPGYLDADDFSKILRYFGDDHYKSISWKDFEKKKK